MPLTGCSGAQFSSSNILTPVLGQYLHCPISSAPRALRGAAPALCKQPPRAKRQLREQGLPCDAGQCHNPVPQLLGTTQGFGQACAQGHGLPLAPSHPSDLPLVLNFPPGGEESQVSGMGRAMLCMRGSGAGSMHIPSRGESGSSANVDLRMLNFQPVHLVLPPLPRLSLALAGHPRSQMAELVLLHFTPR